MLLFSAQIESEMAKTSSGDAEEKQIRIGNSV